jgi:succinate dehydrogenase/fumarate reductase flavoprotein subunit
MQVDRIEYDIVVVGAGIAGVAAANKAMEEGAKVLLVSKDPLLASDTKISEGIISVRGSGGDDDTADEFKSNMMTSGAGLSDADLVSPIAENSPGGFDWLVKNGLRHKFDPETGKPLPLGTPMGGHSMARSVNVENSGLAHAHALLHAAIANGNIDYLEDAWFIDLYREVGDQGRVKGGLIYHATQGKFISVVAGAVILACGGLSTLYYPHTDCMKGNTGDALAIAARAGAALVDMEQVQFFPFAVAHGSCAGLPLSEPFMAGVLGRLLGAEGQILHEDLSSRTRAECSALIAKSIDDGFGTERETVFFDLTENATGPSGEYFKRIFTEEFPNNLHTAKKAFGSAAAAFKEPWEIAPTAHYCMGGLYITPDAEALDQDLKPIPGLYVAGQSAGGIHGSNRLGSTGLTEGAVYGQISGQAAAKAVKGRNAGIDAELVSLEQEAVRYHAAKFGQKGDAFAITHQRKLQKAAWMNIGPARNAEKIKSLVAEIEVLKKEIDNSIIQGDEIWNQSFIDYIETQNLVLCAEMIAKSALARPNSVGAHVRIDETESDETSDNYSVKSICDDGTIKVSKLERSNLYTDEIEEQKIRALQRKEDLQKIRLMPEVEREEVLTKMYQRLLGDAA